MKKTKITHETLEAFGMKRTPNNGFHLYKKVISEHKEGEEDEGEIALVIADFYGQPSPALFLPGGSTLWLGAVSCIEDLQVFERTITMYQPNY